MRIGIYGFGAVGNAIYGELEGERDLYVLVDENRKKRYENQISHINGRVIHPTYITNGIMDYIFICLKNYQLEDSLEGIRPFIGKKTILIPVLNGIMAHDIIKSYYPYTRVLYGVINVEANRKGSDTICGKILNLQYGDEYNMPVKSDLMELRRILNKHHVNNHIYHNMKRRVWLKWMLNLGINQISALCNATYKDMSHPRIQETFQDVFEEVYQVSLAYNIGLDKDDIETQMYYCKRFNSDRVTSLTLDVNKGGKNEIETFGGTLLTLAKTKGIHVPVNRTIYHLLKAYDDNRKK